MHAVRTERAPETAPPGITSFATLRKEAGLVELHGLSDADAAQRIVDKGMDIAVDMNGYTGGGRPEVLPF